MSKDWRESSVLLVGCGSIGKRHARVLGSLGVRDVRACDPDAAQLEGLLRESPFVRPVTSFDAGLAEKPDVVFILTPPRLHVPMIMQALRAGCHVLSEKPLSDGLDGLDELADLVKLTGLKMMTALCFRYHEGLLQAKRMLEEGKIGRLISIRALMGEHLPEVRPDYRRLHTLKSMGAFDLMHDIDLALWYANQPVRKVCCISGVYADLGFEAPDTVELLIGFQDRLVANVHLDFFQRPRRRVMELIGTEGVISVEFAKWTECTISVWSASVGHWEQRTLPTDRDDMFRAEDREFLEAVAEDKPIRYDVAEARKSIEVIAAAQKAS